MKNIKYLCNGNNRSILESAAFSGEGLGEGSGAGYGHGIYIGTISGEYNIYKEVPTSYAFMWKGSFILENYDGAGGRSVGHGHGAIHNASHMITRHRDIECGKRQAWYNRMEPIEVVVERAHG